MSLEAAIEKLTEVNERLIVAIESTNAQRAEVLAAAQAATAPKAGAKKTDEKKEDPKPAAGGEATGGAAEDKYAGVKAAIAAYAGASDHPPEREARKAKAASILSQVGATKATEVPDDKIDLVVRSFKKLAEDNVLLAPAPEAAGGDADALLG